MNTFVVDGVKVVVDTESGAVANVSFKGISLIGGIQVPVRDENWGTICGQVIKYDLIDYSPHGFNIRFDVENNDEGKHIHLQWTGYISFKNGILTFDFEAKALSSFRSNRLSFCILFPSSTFAGKSVRLLHTNQSETTTKFPLLISPQPHTAEQKLSPMHSFDNIQQMQISFDDFVMQSIFEGEIFEAEDQRNWTDASFKIYGTPITKPFPRHIEKGSIIKQTVQIKIIKSPRKTYTLQIPKLSEMKATLKFPQIGSQIPDHIPLESQIKAPNDHQLLRDLGFDHLKLRLDLHGDWKKRLRGAWNLCEKLKVKALEISVMISADSGTSLQLSQLRDEIEQIKCVVAVLAVFDRNDPDKIVTPALAKIVQETFAGVTHATGSRLFFAEVNRSFSRMATMPWVTYSINPQVHMFDNASLISTLPIQADTVRTLQSKLTAASLQASVFVSTVSLKAIWIDATGGKEGGGADGVPPERADSRQGEPFCAAWTLGSLSYLLPLVQAVTIHEIQGEAGLLHQGRAFPVYYVFRDLAEFKGSDDGRLVVLFQSKDLACIAMRNAQSTALTLLLANMTGKPCTVFLAGQLAAGLNVRRVCLKKGGRITSALEKDGKEPNRFVIALAPYEYVRIDPHV